MRGRFEVRRPYVFLNVASSVDGKIAPANRHFVPFSSKKDQRLLMALRTEADAVMAGARTVDLGKVDLGPGGRELRRKRVEKGFAAYNLRVIVSGSGTLNPRAHIFQKRFSPIIVLTTERASKHQLRELAAVADEVKVFGGEELDFTAALQWLREACDVKRLLCEGGGELNAGLLRERLVDRIYLTISPVVFCGRDAPTLADGEGFLDVGEAIRVRLKSLEKSGDELFLIYDVIHKKTRSD